MANGRHRVVIVGGGFGGLNVARALAKSDVDVTIVDRTNHHLFQPLLYQVAAGIMPPGLIAPAIRSTIKGQKNTGRCSPRSRISTWRTRWCTPSVPTAGPSTCRTTPWWWRPGRRTRTSARTSSPNSRRA